MSPLKRWVAVHSARPTPIPAPQTTQPTPHRTLWTKRKKKKSMMIARKRIQKPAGRTIASTRGTEAVTTGAAVYGAEGAAGREKTEPGAGGAGSREGAQR